jgi:hypothetical protein
MKKTDKKDIKTQDKSVNIREEICSLDIEERLTIIANLLLDRLQSQYSSNQLGNSSTQK